MSGKNASRIEDLYRWIAHDFTLTTIFDVKQMQKVNVLSTIAPMQGVYWPLSRDSRFEFPPLI